MITFTPNITKTSSGETNKTMMRKTKKRKKKMRGVRVKTRSQKNQLRFNSSRLPWRLSPKQWLIS